MARTYRAHLLALGRSPAEVEALLAPNPETEEEALTTEDLLDALWPERHLPPEQRKDHWLKVVLGAAKPSGPTPQQEASAARDERALRAAGL